MTAKCIGQLCRCITTPAISDKGGATECLRQMEMKLKMPWRDGTTYLPMSRWSF